MGLARLVWALHRKDTASRVLSGSLPGVWLLPLYTHKCCPQPRWLVPSPRALPVLGALLSTVSSRRQALCPVRPLGLLQVLVEEMTGVRDFIF